MAQRPPTDRREFALYVLKTLREQGFEAYWAGGCVRDHLLHLEPKDYDIATNAVPDEIRRVFGPRRTLAIGAAFGVIAVVGPKPAGIVEVTTFRQESSYSDGRHPDQVCFSTAEIDALRRDFTINGLFYDPVEDRVIDYVGGVDDLKAGLVRAIGTPRARFSEDKLRLLRAVRMAARFDFTIDPPTQAAICELADLVTTVSAERIGQEMRLLLVLEHRARGIELLATCQLLPSVLPELTSLHGQADWDETLRLLGGLRAPPFPLALAVLLHRAAREDATIVAAVAQRWRLSNAEHKTTAWLIENEQQIVDARQRPWSQLQPLLVNPHVEELLEWAGAWARMHHQPLDDVAYCRQRLALPPEELDPPPLVTGHDLIEHGVPRGRRFAKLLETVRAAQLDGLVQSLPQALELVDRWLAEHPRS